MKIEAEGIGPPEMGHTPAGPRQRADGARPEAEGVLLERVVVEDRPGPPDHRIRVHVRPVVQPILLHQTVAHRDDCVEVVDAEGIGGAHARDECSNALALVDRATRRLFQEIDSDVVGRPAPDCDDVLLANPQPARYVEPRVMALLRRQDDGVAAHPREHRSGKRLLQADPDAVQVGSGSAEGKETGGAVGVVPDQGRRHRDDACLDHHDAVRRIIGHEIGVVDCR